jgi:hypothetical protein
VDLSGAGWRKSSFSGENGNGDGCVSVAFLPDGPGGPANSSGPGGPATSSGPGGPATSSSPGGPANSGGPETPGRPGFNDGAVALRDCKDRSRRPHVYPARAWACFLSGVRAGEFDLPVSA